MENFNPYGDLHRLAWNRELQDESGRHGRHPQASLTSRRP